MKEKKISGDVEFSDCMVEESKNWRGNEEIENIEGYPAKKYKVMCNIGINIKKRQVVFDKDLRSIRNFDEYFKYCLKDTRTGLILQNKFEKSSVKKIKTAVWGSQTFPMKIEDLMPLMDLLATVSQKARRFHEFLISTQLFQSIGFPIKAKIPLMLTITALVEFKAFKFGEVEDSEFFIKEYICKKLKTEEEYMNPSSSYIEEYGEENYEESEVPKDEDSETILGPKLKMLPMLQLDNEEIEITFVKENTNFGDEFKERLKAVELHNVIMEKIKLYIGKERIQSNDIDVII